VAAEQGADSGVGRGVQRGDLPKADRSGPGAGKDRLSAEGGREKGMDRRDSSSASAAFVAFCLVIRGIVCGVLLFRILVDSNGCQFHSEQNDDADQPSLSLTWIGCLWLSVKNSASYFGRFFSRSAMRRSWSDGAMLCAIALASTSVTRKTR